MVHAVKIGEECYILHLHIRDGVDFSSKVRLYK